jgi:hypothetical protein
MMATPKKQTISASAAALGLPTSALVKPKPIPTPKPVPKPTPKPVASKFTPEVPKKIASTLAQLEQESKDATAALDVAMTEANTAALAGDTNVAEANALLEANKKVVITDPVEDLLVAQNAARIAEADRRDRQSAYDILYNQFNQYGLGSLVEDIKYLIQSNVSPSQFSLELQNTKAYQNRFAANKERIAKGLSALSPAEYIGLEDQYQNVMRNYGLPASYYTKDATGKQAGFEKFLAGDVSASELEDRISTAQKRVINANPEVTTALKQFYPDITNADILAYTLDPSQGLESIKRKVTAAEIGGAALSQTGLTTSLARAEELQRYGVDKEAATAGYSAIGGGLQRGSQLASIYQQDPYTQTTAEEEIFKLSGQQEARKQRQKITGLEKATFGGQTGLTSGALARDRAGGY